MKKATERYVIVYVIIILLIIRLLYIIGRKPAAKAEHAGFEEKDRGER